MPKPAKRIADAFGKTNAIRNLAAFSLCFGVYFLVIEIFLAVPAFNQDIQVRPVSALGPVLGLFFSWPGVFGSACANLLSDAFHMDGGYGRLPIYFVIQLVYDSLPYLVWYLVNRRRKSPFPSADSAFKVAVFLFVSFLDSVVVSALLLPFDDSVFAAMNVYLAHMLNDFIFLVYLGIPLLIAFDKLPVEPIAPTWISARYRQKGRASLSQKITVAFTFTLGAMMALFVGMSLLPGALLKGADFADVVASVYLQTSLLTLVAFVPLVALLAWMERSITTPLDALISQSRGFALQLRAKAAEGDNAPLGEAACAGSALPDAKREAEGPGLYGTEFIGCDQDVLTKEAFEGLRPGPEMSDLVDSVCLMRGELESYVSRLAAVAAERERTAAELDIARSIQMGAMPRDFSASAASKGLLIEGFMRPAREVGGDFYDVFDADGGKVAFVIGDVSGKGVPAALFMMKAQSLLRERIQECSDLGCALSQVNDVLCDRNDAMLFVTAFVCVFDPETGQVRFANAGHNPPVVLQQGVRSFLKVRPGLVLGAMEGMSYREGSIDLGAGDGLLLYTDGVTEATNPQMELFGEGRLMDVLNGCDSEGSAFVAKRIEAAVDAFAGECPQADDITVLGLCRKNRGCDMRSIDLQPDLSELEVLNSFLEDLCGRDGCTPKMLMQLSLAAEEIFVNICRYGFADGRPKKPVSITAVMDDEHGRMRMEFSDAGVPYNPLEYKSQRADANDAEREGGLGILLVRRNVDCLDYEYLDGRNILSFEKKYM